MWCLVGLGNPGVQYEGTRHNIGFELIDWLSSRWKIPVDQKTPLFHFGSGDYREHPVLLVKPMTYMNRSGEAIKRLVKEPEIELERMVVLYDDFNLPLGKIRLRCRGSHGGHNGLRSILESLESEEVPRLRIGIDKDEGDIVDYVLSRFTPKEREVMDEALIRSADAMEAALFEGFEKAMNEFNR